ncbi:hypothetical protein BOO92_13725 [Vibrio navarrensis]|nr:hypothetical protein [Vibrio navarrensis]
MAYLAKPTSALYMHVLKIIVMAVIILNPVGVKAQGDRSVSVLYEQYGTIERIVENLNELSYTEQAMVRKHLTELELERLAAIGDQKFALEEQKANAETEKELYKYKKANDPELILKQRQIQLQADQARHSLLVEPPKSLIDVIRFDPSLPQELKINVYPGFPAAISFYDNTGATWPIAEVKLGANGIFAATQTPQDIYTLEALKPGAIHSGWFVLRDLDTVIPFRISSQYNQYVNTRRQIIVPQIGPNAQVAANSQTINTSRNDAVSDEIFAFMNGTFSSIEGARALKMTGISGQAFEYKSNVYIRTTAVLRGAAGSLVEEHSLGKNNLYVLHKRTFYWFTFDSKKVRGYVHYE